MKPRTGSIGMKRQRRKEGNVYKIDLGDGTHVYAREGPFSAAAIYDSRTNRDLVYRRSSETPCTLLRGCYEIRDQRSHLEDRGSRPLADAPLPEVPPKGIKDVHDKNKFRIYFNIGLMRSATREEIEDLEPAMLWHPERVQQRLLDYYNGFPDRWKDSLPSYYSVE